MTAPVSIKIYQKPPIPAKEILRYAGYPGNALPEEAEAALAALPATLCGRVAYAVYDLRRTQTGLDLGFAVTDSKDLQKNLAGCGGIVLFAATAGIEFDRLVQKYQRLSPVKALWFQSIGAAYIESVCDLFCGDLKAAYGKLKPRFSPGYGDLPLAIQKDVFAALQCERQLGLTLNDDLFMTPTKSVTAVVGVLSGDEDENH